MFLCYEKDDFQPNSEIMRLYLNYRDKELLV